MLLRPTLALAVLSLSACGDERPATAGSRGPTLDVVAVASAPAELFARMAVGPERVIPAAPEGTSMTDWRPTDAELETMVGARRVVVVGADLEPWLQRAGLPPSRTLVLADRSTDSQWIEVGVVTHTHGGGEAHSHGGVVSEVWTDPGLARRFVERAAGELASVVDGAEDGGGERRRALLERIDAYEAALGDLADALDSRALIAADHGLEYAARAGDFALEVALLELDGSGAPPNGQGVRDLERFAADASRHAGVLVWPGPIDETFAEAARGELGLVSVHFDLGATLDGSGDDCLARLTASVERVRKAVLEARSR